MRRPARKVYISGQGIAIGVKNNFFYLPIFLKEFAMSHKSLLCLGLTFFLSLQFAAASGSPEAPKASAPTTIRFAWWTTEERTAITLETIAAYEKANPGVTIVPEYAGYAGFWDKIAVQIAAKEAPDVFQNVVANLPQHVRSSVIAPLTGSSFDFAKVDASALAEWQIKGAQYGLPLGLNGWAILYNPEIFKAAGARLPFAEWTWKDFEEMCTTITKKTGLYAVTFVSFSQDFPFLIRSAGVKMYAPDGKSLGFTDPALLTDYYSMMLRLQESGAMPPRSVMLDFGNNWAANPITAGKSAMVFIPSNQAGPINQGLGKALPFCTLPSTAANKAQLLQGTLGVVMAETSKYKAAASSFLNYVSTSVEALSIGKANRGVPATAEARKAMLSKGVDSTIGEALKFVDLAMNYSSPVLWDYPTAHAEIAEKMGNKLLDEVLFKVKTPAEASAFFMKEANAILAR